MCDAVNIISHFAMHPGYPVFLIQQVLGSPHKTSFLTSSQGDAGVPGLQTILSDPLAYGNVLVEVNCA